MPPKSYISEGLTSETNPISGQLESLKEGQRRRDLWQTTTWLIVFLCTLPLMSGPIIGLSPVSEVVAILLALFFLAGLFWLLLLLRGGSLKLVTSIDLSLASVWLALLITAVFSIDPSRSWRVAAYWTAFIVVFYMVVLAVRSGWRTANIIRAYLMVMSIYIAVGYLELVVQLAKQFATEGSLSVSWSGIRIAGLANNPNPFAGLLAIGVTLAMASQLERRKEGNRWPSLVWLIAAAPMVVLNGSRNGWLATVVGLTALLLFRQLKQFSPHLPPRRTWIRLGGFLIIALITILLLVLIFRPHRLNLLSDSGYANRSAFWRIAIETWLGNTLIGQGPGTYATAFLRSVNVPFEPLFVAAHSFWFDTLSEMGLVGIAAYIFLAGQVVNLAYRGLRGGSWTSETPGLLAALTAVGAFSMLDTPWIHLKFLAAVILAAFVGQVEPDLLVQKRLPSWRRWLPKLWLPIWAILIVAGTIGWLSARDYSRGISSASNARWDEALAKFEAAEARLPYRDAASSLAKGYSAGVLALTDESFLPLSVAAFETVVDLEPGWSLNWANLAALQWQAGQHDEAIASMKIALDRAPSVPVYLLNLAIWQEQTERNAEAVNTYRELLLLEPDVADAGFWSATEVRQEAIGFKDAGTGGEQSEKESASAAARLGGESQNLDPKEPVEDAEVGNSIYGFGQTRRSNYLREVFVRYDLPGELLPQLLCPDPRTEDSDVLDLMKSSAGRNGQESLPPALDTSLVGEHDGLVSCLQPDLVIPQTVD